MPMQLRAAALNVSQETRLISVGCKSAAQVFTVQLQAPRALAGELPGLRILLNNSFPSLHPAEGSDLTLTAPQCMLLLLVA